MKDLFEVLRKHFPNAEFDWSHAAVLRIRIDESLASGSVDQREQLEQLAALEKGLQSALVAWEQLHFPVKSALLDAFSRNSEERAEVIESAGGNLHNAEALIKGVISTDARGDEYGESIGNLLAAMIWSLTGRSPVTDGEYNYHKQRSAIGEARREALHVRKVSGRARGEETWRKICFV